MKLNYIKSIKGFTLIFSFLLLVQNTKSQPLNFETLIGINHFFYQHSISKKLFSTSRFSIKHIASVIVPYTKNPESGGKGNELMNQAYLGYLLTKFISLHVGGFYTNVTDIRPSFAMQFVVIHKNFLFVSIPRFDVMRNGAFDVFTLTEFTPVIFNRLKLYTRIQTMTNIGPSHHNRGYQQFRLGIKARSEQFGLGLNWDEYGENFKMYWNVGVFVKKEVF